MSPSHSLCGIADFRTRPIYVFQAEYGDEFMDASAKTISVKRYARSRLYDTGRGCYVSVDQLRQWRNQGRFVYVIDVETGRDVIQVLLA